MKYMTFRGSHVYTCLAIMLEDFKINKTDQDIVLEMRMPYLFTKEVLSKTKTSFTAGTKLQSKKWYDLFLNHYQLEFIEEYLTRLQVLVMLKNLHKFRRKALLSLTMNEKKYAVVFSHYDIQNDLYSFIMPEDIPAKDYRYLELDEKQLLNYLTNKVHIGYINPTDDKYYLMIAAIKESLTVLDDYLLYIQDWCQMKHTKKRQLEAFDMVFRSFLVDLRRILKLKEEKELYHMIRKLSHQYVKYLKTDEERFLIPLEKEFTEAITTYQSYVKDYYKHSQHTLKF